MATSPYKSARAQQEARSRKLRAVAAAAIAVALIAILIGVAGGIGPVAAPDEGTSGAAAAGSADASAQTRTIVDTEGRSVAIPIAPQRVAVLDSFAGELSIMLGAGEQVLGVPGGVMSDAILQSIYPGLEGLAQLSGSAVNVEELVAQGCDMALVRTSLQDSERAELERVGIPYVVVGYSTLDEQLAALDVVAEAFGGEAQRNGARIREFFDSVVALVDERTPELPEDGRVRVYHSINGALLCDAAGSLGASWMERAGLVCVSADETPTSGSDYNATLEQIYVWNPDAIVCSVAATEGEIAADPQWESLAAVKEGRLYHLPIGATRWGQRGSVETPLAMLWAGCTFYPDAYADVDMESLVRGYYRDCLGVDMDEVLYEQVLSGEGIRTNGNGSGNPASEKL